MKDPFVTVVTFLWDDPERDKTHSYKFGPEHVVILRNMVRRHLTIPHEFVCVSDKSHPLLKDEKIRRVPLDISTHVPNTVFARLFMRHPNIACHLGKRILSLDLDCIICGNMDDIVGRTEDNVLWHNPNYGLPRRAFYQTSIQLFSAGARSELWSDFSPEWTPKWANRRRFGGAEQAWVSERLDWDEAYWDGSHGVYGAGRGEGKGPRKVLPENAKIVFFPGGNRAPHLPETQAEYPWCKEFYK